MLSLDFMLLYYVRQVCVTLDILFSDDLNREVKVMN